MFLLKFCFQILIYFSLVFFCTKTQANTFSGWSSTLRGNIRTVGMAGPMAGLADNFYGNIINPSGTAMTVSGLGLHFASNLVSDANLSSLTKPNLSNTTGMALNLNPWGVSVGYWSPQVERREAIINGQLQIGRLVTRELHTSVSHLFLERKLSLGLGLITGWATRSLDLNQEYESSTSLSSLNFGISMGALYRLPKRILIGASLQTPMRYGAVDFQSQAIPDHGNEVVSPLRFHLGASWIPNRVFRVATSISAFDANPSGYLFSEPTLTSGARMIIQPQFGFTYRPFDFENFLLDLFTGTYFETSRIENSPNRLHWTIGFDFDFWLLSLGFAVDTAPNYNNTLFSFAFDAGRVLRKLKLIPDLTPREKLGTMPIPWVISADGLPNSLLDDSEIQSDARVIDVVDITKKMPKQIFSIPQALPETLWNTPGDIRALGSDLWDAAIDTKEWVKRRINNSTPQNGPVNQH